MRTNNTLHFLWMLNKSLVVCPCSCLTKLPLLNYFVRLWEDSNWLNGLYSTPTFWHNRTFISEWKSLCCKLWTKCQMISCLLLVWKLFQLLVRDERHLLRCFDMAGGQSGEIDWDSGSSSKCQMWYRVIIGKLDQYNWNGTHITLLHPYNNG